LQLLGLPVLIKPCPRQTLFKEGAFDTNAVFRKEAWEIYEQENQNDEKEMKMTYQFPLLVDETSSSSSPEIVSESSTIIRHLWEKYSDNVIEERPSVDLKLNSNGLPFFVFLCSAHLLPCVHFHIADCFNCRLPFMHPR